MNVLDYDIRTPRKLAGNIAVFQALLVDNSEEKTVNEIYQTLSPHSDSLVLDLGCGVGGVSRLMLEIDDTLKFLCVSNSQFQIDYITSLYNPSVAAINADFANLPIPDSSVDYIMLNESIGYGDLTKILSECYRVLKTGGRCLIKDFLFFEENKGYNESVLSGWGYYLHTKEKFLAISECVGFNKNTLTTPVCGSKKYADFVYNDPYMRAMFHQLGNASEAVDKDVNALFLLLTK
jgi:ubiquinone/menaquinone biosynthesis C-methylase UbiE